MEYYEVKEKLRIGVIVNIFIVFIFNIFSGCFEFFVKFCYLLGCIKEEWILVI